MNPAPSFVLPAPPAPRWLLLLVVQENDCAAAAKIPRCLLVLIAVRVALFSGASNLVAVLVHTPTLARAAVTLGWFVVALLSATGDVEANEALPLTLVLDSALLGLAGQSLWFLEAVAPLVVGQLAVLEGIAGVEEGLHAQLILVQVNGTELGLVQQEVKVHVELVEHPAQRVLANGQDAGVEVSSGGVKAVRGFEVSVGVEVENSEPVL